MAPTTTSLSAVDSMSQSSAPASQSGMFPPGLAGTPPKEYSQSGVRHTKVCDSGLCSCEWNVRSDFPFVTRPPTFLPVHIRFYPSR